MGHYDRFEDVWYGDINEDPPETAQEIVESAQHSLQQTNGAEPEEITPCVNAPACKFEGTTICRQCVNESEFFPA